MLTTESISNNPNAAVIVLFGGNPYRRDEVINHLKTLDDYTIYGTLSEEEGIEKITSLPKVDLVLIGGRYSHEQRVRIKQFVSQQLPNTKVSEPGVEYPYDNIAIHNELKNKLHNSK